MSGQAPRFTIFLLALAQAAFSCSILVVVSSASLVGFAPDPGLNTLPITTYVSGGLLATLPISFLMKRFGRKIIFFWGAIAAMLGGALGCWAIFNTNFAAFCLGTFLIGFFQATSSFNSFAAVEVAKPEDKQLSISWVLTGGVVAAVIGSYISRHTSHLYEGFVFAGSYGAVAVLAAVAAAVILLMELPRVSSQEVDGPQRSWQELLREPRLVAAMAAAIVSYGLMNLMMTAAPGAMKFCGFSTDDSTFVIQWHVLGMFVPSFFTGNLIKRFGVELITSVGMLILVTAGLGALAGISFTHFTLALILLGCGWNFSFIGGTTMLTQIYRPSEKAKVQGVNNLGIAGLQVCTSAAAGAMNTHWGWNSIPYVVIPVSVLMLLMVQWIKRAAAPKLAT